MVLVCEARVAAGIQTLPNQKVMLVCEAMAAPRSDLKPGSDQGVMLVCKARAATGSDVSA